MGLTVLSFNQALSVGVGVSESYSAWVWVMDTEYKRDKGVFKEDQDGGGKREEGGRGGLGRRREDPRHARRSSEYRQLAEVRTKRRRGCGDCRLVSHRLLPTVPWVGTNCSGCFWVPEGYSTESILPSFSELYDETVLLSCHGPDGLGSIE